jgi:hypothetical protein
MAGESRWQTLADLFPRRSPGPYRREGADAVTITWTPLEQPMPANKIAYRTYAQDGQIRDIMEVGLLLKFEDGTVALVGDLNTRTGVCDDCTEDGVVVATSRDLIPIVDAAIEGSE